MNDAIDIAFARELLNERRYLRRKLEGLTNRAIARKLDIPTSEVDRLAREMKQTKRYKGE